MAQIEVGPLSRCIQTEGVVQFYHLSIDPIHKQTEPQVSKEALSSFVEGICCLFNTFNKIFMAPTELPPPRQLDHRIPLLPNATPVNVRPYRYPHFQKAEIEKLVGEMLRDGVIRPSTSPSSSPILLVKKKTEHGVSVSITEL